MRESTTNLVAFALRREVIMREEILCLHAVADGKIIDRLADFAGAKLINAKRLAFLQIDCLVFAVIQL